jgi:tyrosyl-tRNA synthetase
MDLISTSVKNKMSKGDGMSFAEFTYPLLQAWDWWHMYKTLGIQMQIGGSDQYGNITAGMDAVRYIAKTHPDAPKKTDDDLFGFTTPLLTTSTGAKFGKSAGNAIWLEKSMTSCFDLYAYFLKTLDADVAKYLKLLTFMPISHIDDLMAEHMKNPSLRKAQHKLASEFVELVHGSQEARTAAEQHNFLHKNHNLSQETPKSADDPVGAVSNPNTRPAAHIKLPRSFIETKSIGKILFACGLAESASEGHRLASLQSVFVGVGATNEKEEISNASINWFRVNAWKPEETQNFLIHGTLLMLRRGKHNIRVIEVVEDDMHEVFAARYPGVDKSDPTIEAKVPAPQSSRQINNVNGEAGSTTNYIPVSENVKTCLERDESVAPENDLSSSSCKTGIDVEVDQVIQDMTPEQRLKMLEMQFERDLKEYQAKKDATIAPNEVII